MRPPSLLALTFLSCVMAEGFKPQPEAKSTYFQEADVKLNNYIPHHTIQDNYVRFLSLDCSDSFVEERRVLELLDNHSPDVAVFIKFPRSPWEMETMMSWVGARGYQYTTAGDAFLVISRFPIEDVAEPIERNGVIVAADVRVRVHGKPLHVLPIAFSKIDKEARKEEAMEVLYRAGSILSNGKPFVLLGSTGSGKEEDNALQTLYSSPLVTGSFKVLGWPQPKYTDKWNRPMDHIFLSKSLSPYVQGSFAVYSDMSSHLALIADVSSYPFNSSGLQNPNPTYSWGRFSQDLLRVMTYWVPLVAVGALIVLILGVIQVRREKRRRAKNAEQPSDVLMTSAQDQQAGWDVIHVSPDHERKERMASFDSNHSSLQPAAPQVVRIQTPPQYDPPPYSPGSPGGGDRAGSPAGPKN